MQQHGGSAPNAVVQNGPHLNSNNNRGNEFDQAAIDNDVSDAIW